MGAVDFETHMGSDVVAPYVVERFVGAAGHGGSPSLYLLQLDQPAGDFSDPPLSDLVVTTGFTAHRSHLRNGDCRFSGETAPGQWSLLARGEANSIIIDNPTRFAALAIPASVADPLLDRLWPAHRSEAERLHALQASAQVPQLIARMWDSAGAGRGADAGQLYCEELITAFIGELMRASQIPVPPFRGGLAGWQMRRVADYIENRYNTDIALGDLAAMCGLSDDHFARAFRRSFGVPPYRYQLRLRLDRARTLLANPDLPVAAIAAMVGFARPQGLTRLFLRELGMTPIRYRRDVLGR